LKIDTLMNALGELPDEMILEASPACAAQARPQRAARPRRRRILRTTLIAAVLVMLLSVTVYAAGGGLGGLFTYQDESWTSLDRLPRAEKKIGLDMIVPEEFSNGFRFEKMAITMTDEINETGEVVESYPSLSVHYGHAGESVRLEIMADRPQPHNGSWEQREIDDVTLWCEDFTLMVVPEGYRPTEEELARAERGELMISYGSDEVQIMSSSFVQFTLDGGLYSLLNMDGMRVDELADMAAEIIRSG